MIPKSTKTLSFGLHFREANFKKAVYELPELLLPTSNVTFAENLLFRVCLCPKIAFETLNSLYGFDTSARL